MQRLGGDVTLELGTIRALRRNNRVWVSVFFQEFLSVLDEMVDLVAVGEILVFVELGTNLQCFGTPHIATVDPGFREPKRPPVECLHEFSVLLLKRHWANQ